MASTDVAYVPSLAIVREALETLINLDAHRSFAGYLCALNAAALAKRHDQLRPDFKAFFDRYFRIGAAPQNKPYAVPFTKNAKNVLFNANVAGSYAPSSIRAVSPLHTVMIIEGGGTQAVFSLRPNHAEIARQSMLPEPLPVAAFATFFYRDIGFTAQPDRGDVEQAVLADFGFALGDNLYRSGLFADDFESFPMAAFEAVEVAA